MVEENKFRRDLYHRLKVGVIRLPTLAGAAGRLAAPRSSHFLKDLWAEVRQAGADRRRAGAEGVRTGTTGPGNVRELRNVLESMVVLDADNVLGTDDVPEDAEPGEAPRRGGGEYRPGRAPMASLGRPLAEVERYYTERALARHRSGNREEASQGCSASANAPCTGSCKQWKKEDDDRAAGN